MASEEDYRQQELVRTFSKKKITTILEFYMALSSSLTNCNARQFDVPPSYLIDGLLPYGLMPYKGLAQPRQIIIDEPCTLCEGIGEESPKIQCDFCKYVYHIDCLRFPLCSPPSEAWMCPNHVEPIVDLKLLSSISFTERRRIWAKYARQPVDEMTIRRKFVEKVISDRPELRKCILKDKILSKK
ncbi:hypothetical protein OSTOST_13152 [Ostertagia ostertagi]